MTKDDLLAKLTELQGVDDTERAHEEADTALLTYINDADITAAFSAILRWYA